MAVREVPEELNLAAVHEAIAAVVPERECIVWRDRRLTWAEVTDRTPPPRRAAAAMQGWAPTARWPSSHGVGVAARPRRPLPPQRQRVPRGACSAPPRPGARPFNVNYRYVAEELQYLLTDADATASCSTPRSRRRSPRCSRRSPTSRLLLQVDDGSGTPLLPGAVAYEDALAGRHPRRPPVGLSPTTSTSSTPAAPPGMPKGVLWRQADFLAACLGHRRRPPPTSSSSRPRTGSLRALPAPPFMHGAAHWNALSAPGSAGGTVVHPGRPGPPRPRRRAGHGRARSTSRRCSSSATPSPGRSSTRCGTGRHDASGLRLLLTGGAVALAAREGGAPGARSPTCTSSTCSARRRPAARASTRRPARGAATGTFDRSPDHRRARPTTSPAASSPATASWAGWPRPAGYPSATSATRPRPPARSPSIDGVRHAVRRRPGPRARRRRRRAPRPRLRDHQHRRREGVRGGGRAGAQAPPGRVRRRGRRAGRASAGARRWSASCSCARAPTPTDDDLRSAAAAARGPLQAPEGVRARRPRRAQPERQARLPLGDRRGRPEPASWRLRRPCAVAMRGARSPCRSPSTSGAPCARCASASTTPPSTSPTPSWSWPCARPLGPATLRASEHRGDRVEVEAWGDGAEWALDTAPGAARAASTTGPASTRSTPSCARLHREADGLRLPRTGRVLDALVPAVLSQRVTGFEAKRSYRQLVERWGEPAPGPTGLTLAPRPT